MVFAVGWIFVLSGFAFMVYFLFYSVEYFYCVFHKNQVPFVGSSRRQRRAVVDCINKYYPDAKNCIEMGSGYGGLARYIARHTKLKVWALENMPYSVLVSRFFDLFCRANSQTIKSDVFEFIDNSKQNFDIAVAYLGPFCANEILRHNKKIKVLISLNFEVQGLEPVRVIDLKCGYVLYGFKKYPHKLFVYEF